MSPKKQPVFVPVVVFPLAGDLRLRSSWRSADINRGITFTSSLTSFCQFVIMMRIFFFSTAQIPPFVSSRYLGIMIRQTI